MDFRVSQPLDGRWRTGARLERDGEERRLIKYFLMLRLIAATSRVGASRCATLASVRAPVAAIAQRRWLSSGGVVEVPIPLLGAESIVEGNVLSIAKKVGDYVAKEEMVAEIETDKVTIEAKSPEAGTITAMAPAPITQCGTDCSRYCKVFLAKAGRLSSGYKKQALTPILGRSVMVQAKNK